QLLLILYSIGCRSCLLSGQITYTGCRQPAAPEPHAALFHLCCGSGAHCPPGCRRGSMTNSSPLTVRPEDRNGAGYIGCQNVCRRGSVTNVRGARLLSQSALKTGTAREHGER
ncbi:unnamed protein product, partial [Staurois parvus]